MLITNENFLFYIIEKEKNIPCSKTGYTFKFVRLVETDIWNIIGKSIGRHQGKRLSILQQPDLKFSANFTNSIIRKRAEAFQLKYNAAARNLHRNKSMV